VDRVKVLADVAWQGPVVKGLDFYSWCIIHSLPRDAFIKMRSSFKSTRDGLVFTGIRGSTHSAVRLGLWPFALAASIIGGGTC
jgi:hypothetical protein